MDIDQQGFVCAAGTRHRWRHDGTPGYRCHYSIHRQQFQHPAQSSSTSVDAVGDGTSECHLYGIAVYPCPPRRSYGSPWRYGLYECRCGCRSCGTICQWRVPDIAQCTGSRGLHIASQCLGCGRGDRCRPCEAACATVILLVVESQQQFHVQSQCPLFHQRDSMDKVGDSQHDGQLPQSVALSCHLRRQSWCRCQHKSFVQEHVQRLVCLLGGRMVALMERHCLRHDA